MNCPNCGGTMLGDGFNTVRHCEFSDDVPDIEPDAGPIFCKENTENYSEFPLTNSEKKTNITYMLKSSHTLSYEISESDLEDVPTQRSELTFGEVTLPQLLELFEKYIRMAGYVPPDDAHLDFVEND